MRWRALWVVAALCVVSAVSSAPAGSVQPPVAVEPTVTPSNAPAAPAPPATYDGEPTAVSAAAAPAAPANADPNVAANEEAAPAAGNNADANPALAQKASDGDATSKHDDSKSDSTMADNSSKDKAESKGGSDDGKKGEAKNTADAAPAKKDDKAAVTKDDKDATPDLSEVAVRLESVPRGHLREMKHASCAKSCLQEHVGTMDLMEAPGSHERAKLCVLQCLSKPADLSEDPNEAALPTSLADANADSDAAVAAVSAGGGVQSDVTVPAPQASGNPSPSAANPTSGAAVPTPTNGAAANGVPATNDAAAAVDATASGAAAAAGNAASDAAAGNAASGAAAGNAASGAAAGNAASGAAAGNAASDAAAGNAASGAGNATETAPPAETTPEAPLSSDNSTETAPPAETTPEAPLSSGNSTEPPATEDAPADSATQTNGTGSADASSDDDGGHTAWLHELTCVSQCLFAKHNTEAEITPCMDECTAKKEGVCVDDQDCADGFYCADHDEDASTTGMCGKKYLHFCEINTPGECPSGSHCIGLTEDEHGFCIDGEGNMVTAALAAAGHEEDPAVLAFEEEAISAINPKGKPDPTIKLHKVVTITPMSKEEVDAMPEPEPFYEEGEDALHPTSISKAQARSVSFAELGETTSLRTGASWATCGKVGSEWGASNDCDNPAVRDKYKPDGAPYYEARIGFHFAVPSSGGDSTLTNELQQKVAAQMTTMNQTYKSVRIYWTAKVYFWASDKLYNSVVEKTGASADDVCKQCARTVPESQRPAYCTGSSSPYCCLNPHLVADENKCLAFDQVVSDIQTAGSSAGVSFTDHFQGYAVNFIQSTLAGFAYMQGNYPESGQIALSLNRIGGKMMTLPHEAGHALELKHTFTGTDEQSSCSSSCYESASSSDRDIVGDLCADTNPNIRHFNCANPGSNDKCTNNALTNTPYTNVMSYGVDSCRAVFTSCQASRARCWLVNGPRTKVMFSTLDGEPDVACGLTCANGGTLDSAACTCTCSSGYSGKDCTLTGDGSTSSSSSTQSTSSSSSSSPASQNIPALMLTFALALVSVMML